VFAHELTKRGLNFQRQHPIPLTYEGINLEAAFRADLIVEDKIILEIKAVESLNPLFKTQLRTYLRLANKRLGFLINFNGILLKKQHNPRSQPTSRRPRTPLPSLAS
jgi:GxxExxY protein